MKKKKIKIQAAAVILVRIIFFFLFPAIFATAFSGVKYIFLQIGAGKSIEMNAFLLTLIAVSLFTMLFGRFFCGFACAFGSYGDFIYFLSSTIRKKRKKKPFQLPEKVSDRLRYLKYLILIAIVLICLIGNANAIAVNSPWTVFSRIQTGKLPSLGYGLLLLLLITIGMVFERRFFCRFLCPMGAVFALIPVLPVSAVKRDRESCIPGCRACKIKCPARLDIAESSKGDSSSMGECFSCGKCMELCPKNNIHTGWVHGKGHVFVWNLARAVLFTALFWILAVL